MACLWGAILIELMDVIKHTPVRCEDSELGKRGESRAGAKEHALLSDCGCDLTNALSLLGCGFLL